MKILFCLGSMDKGGTQRVVSTLANDFSKNNEVFIMTTSNRKGEYELSPTIKRLCLDTKMKKSNYNRLKYIKEILIKEKFDIIVTMQPEPSYRILLLKKYAKCPIILSVRNDPVIEYKSLKRKILMRLLYKKADGYVFQTNDAKKYFQKKIQRKSAIIANPLNEKFIVPVYDGKKEKTIVTVGRLTQQKNQKLLIKSFSKIVLKYPDYKLKIYGEGAMENELKQYCKELGLEKKVCFMGISDKIEKEIIKDEIFVLSSDYEGMPNALMEAMALGLPCISTNCPCGGPKDLIINKKNGILVNVDDESQMTEAIENLIDNKELKLTLSKNALKIRDKYNSKEIIDKWKEFIENTRSEYGKH